jgi:hypothetical protein
MSFDPAKQNARADTILANFNGPSIDVHMKALTAEQFTLIRGLARHIYAIAYEEGWEDARTRP